MGMSVPTPFKRLILRAVLRNVNPMVIRLVAVPDFLDLADFDEIFHAVLGWDSESCPIQDDAETDLVSNAR